MYSVWVSWHDMFCIFLDPEIPCHVIFFSEVLYRWYGIYAFFCFFFHFADDMGVCVFWVYPTIPMSSIGTIYIKPFSFIEFICTVRQPGPYLHAFCERGVLFHMSHLQLHFTLHISRCALHTPHFTLRPSHSTLHISHSTLQPSHSTLQPSHYTLRTPYFPILLCTTKLAQNTLQHYFVLQSWRKVQLEYCTRIHWI